MSHTDRLAAQRASTQPGWYAKDPYTMEYWDGAEWTGRTRPNTGGGTVATAEDTEGAGALVVIGYILAVLMPLIGFILGLVAVTRPVKAKSKHGVWIIVVSIVAFILWIVILAASAHSSTASTTYSY